MRWEAHAAQPILRLELFRHRAFAMVNLASALMYTATEPGEAMRKVWDQARAEYRVILNGFPGIPNRAAPECWPFSVEK